MHKLLEALEAELSQAEQKLEQEGPAPEGTEYRLPGHLQGKQTLRQAVKAGLEQLQGDGRQHYHPREPEARRMKCQDTRPFAYNAQAVVDQSHGVVVAAEVTVEETDSAQLVPMIEKAQQNTGSNKAVLTVADGGYGAGAQVAQASARQHDVLVRPQGYRRQNGYSASDFHYDATSGTVTCPQKKQLDFTREALQKGQKVKIYRCRVKDCPAAALCKDKKGRRVIEIWSHTAAVQAMRERLKQAQAQEQLSQRGRIIERHFAQIKQHDGFRRWTVRGVENVRTQWALINLICNLRVLYSQWAPKKAASG